MFTSTPNYPRNQKCFKCNGDGQLYPFEGKRGIPNNCNACNGMKVIEGRLVVDYPDMPTTRYLHRSAGVKINGHSHLIVFGGKIN